MIKAKKMIQNFCKTNGFNFVELGLSEKVPYNKKGDWKDNHTYYIKGFYEGSKRVLVSYGGLKIELTLRVPIEQVGEDGIRRHFIPKEFICPRCSKVNLNLRTDDGHKTYVCPDCYIEKENVGVSKPELSLTPRQNPSDFSEG